MPQSQHPTVANLALMAPLAAIAILILVPFGHAAGRGSGTPIQSAESTEAVTADHAAQAAADAKVEKEAAGKKPAFSGDPYLLSTDAATEEPLGEKPLIESFEGREFRFAKAENFIAFKANPDKFIAAVDKKMVEMQMPFYALDVCPVGGDKLAEVKEPVDKIFKNRLIRFCCNDCAKEFEDDPDAAIQKQNTAVIAKQMKSYPLATCLVSGEKLGGSMGDPVDLVVGNRLVRFCCSNCVATFRKEPEKYLKVLDEAVKKRL